jgi:CRP-like cAMP-binding protein
MTDDVGAALSPFGVKTVGFTASDLSPEARQFLQDKGAVRRYRRGEEVQRRSVVPPYASWLQTGRLRCAGVQADGSELHGGWIMASELFGINCVLVNASSRLTVSVDTAGASVLHFSREVLLEMMVAMPEAGVAVAVGMSRRLRQQYDMIDVVGQRSLGDKLRAVLVWWSTHHGIPARDGSVELWVGQGELAVGVGASRQRVHMELQSLRDTGEIELGYRKLIVRPLFFERMQALLSAG